MLVENGIVNINERDEKGSTPAHKGTLFAYVISVCLDSKIHKAFFHMLNSLISNMIISSSRVIVCMCMYMCACTCVSYNLYYITE